ncbi:MAG TPA: rhodanese-like domain-containing protein [Gammaproteobacteria bacterium]|nr:rhodanese-like domain-containing protein [Gammaproteobacteria bacterium]
MTAKISREELRRKLDAGEDFVLVEALPRKYWAKGHIPGALNLPHDQIDALAPELLPDKNREVVVYCASTACQNSEIAATTLTRLGYKKVHEYVEGKADWEAAGYLLEGIRKSA